MRPNKVAQTFSAALAFQATAEVTGKIEFEGHGEAADPVRDVQVDGQFTLTPQENSVSSVINLSHGDSEFVVNFLPPLQWDVKAKKRYHQLAVAEAKSCLNRGEEAELHALEKLRVSTEKALAPDQILANYRREKVGLEMLQILKKYVRVIPQRQNRTEGKPA